MSCLVCTGRTINRNALMCRQCSASYDRMVEVDGTIFAVILWAAKRVRAADRRQWERVSNLKMADGRSISCWAEGLYRRRAKCEGGSK